MKRIAIHPPLVAAYPVLALYAANAVSIPLPDLWRPLLIALGAGLAAMLIFSLIFRSANRGAFAATVVLVALWLAEPLADNFEAKPYWIVQSILLVGVFAILRWTRQKPVPTHLFNFISVVLTLLATGQIALAFNSHIDRRAQSSTAGSARVGPKPNVYYIILDCYGRSDTLKRTIGFDNSEFISQLESRGFFVAKQSRSNYCQTAISLASSLNFGFVQDLLSGEQTKSDDRRPLFDLVLDNTAMRLYKGAGYTTASVTTGFEGLTGYKSDLDYQGPQALSVFETAVVNKTPFAANSRVAESMFVIRRKKLLAAFDNLVDLSRPAARPRFVISHILAPHPPFVFGPNGEAKREGPFGYWDGSDYMEHVGTKESYAQGYREQAEYLNKKVIEMIDAIRENSATPPIIILQGDHGSKENLSQNSLAKTDLQECFSNLTAILAPKELKAQMYDRITPINLLRLTTNYTTGSKLPNMPDKSYFAPFAFPYEFTDVTQELDKADAANLPLASPAPKSSAAASSAP